MRAIIILIHISHAYLKHKLINKVKHVWRNINVNIESMSSTLRMLRLAMANARLSSARCQHGAVIGRAGKVMAAGFNGSRTMLGGNYVASVHAEMLDLFHLFGGGGQQCKLWG